MLHCIQSGHDQHWFSCNVAPDSANSAAACASRFTTYLHMIMYTDFVVAQYLLYVPYACTALACYHDHPQYLDIFEERMGSRSNLQCSNRFAPSFNSSSNNLDIYVYYQDMHMHVMG